MAKALVPLFLLLVTAFAGCSETNEIPNGFNIDFVNEFSELRHIDVIVVDAGPDFPEDHYEQVEVSVRSGERLGGLYGCVGFTSPFKLKLVMKNGSTAQGEPGARVIETKTWSGVECGGLYTLVIDPSDDMHLYRGQGRPPYRNPMPEVR